MLVAEIVKYSIMQMIWLALLIFIAIWAWPITIICVLTWIVFLIIRSWYRSYRKNAENKKREIENQKIQTIADDNRVLLQDDWRLLTSTIVKSIRQHWDTLEDKFEQHVYEDDYGSTFIDDKFGKELMYFSHTVVLSSIDRLINSGEVKANSFALLPAPPSVVKDLYGIKYEDSDILIANEYVGGMVNDNKINQISDEFLNALYKASDTIVSVENLSNDPANRKKLATLNLGNSLQASQPMRVTHLAGTVFILFYAIYSSKPVTKSSKSASPPIEFTGNDPYKYEEYIKKLLEARGFKAKRTRGSGDYGVDVIASKHGKTFAIQCKLYNHTVGFKAVQEIVSGSIYYEADFAVVVSDNSFTDAARNMARKSKVILAHHKNLIHKLESLLPDDDGEVYDADESDEPIDDQVIQEPVVKRQWTQKDTDELITVVLPTINNDK